MTSKRIYLAISLAALTICLAFPQGVSAQLCNAEAHSWVDAHRSELPRTYDDFSQYPLNYRKAIYSAFRAEQRAQLWQEQFERALLREDLTDLQRDIVLEGIQLATPELFSSLKDRKSPTRQKDLQRVANFERRAREVFGNAKAGALFGRVGPGDVEFGVISPQDRTTMKKGLEKTVACSCSDASDYCSSAFNCQEGGCTPIRDECGTFWTYDCDGQCHSNSTVITDIETEKSNR